MLTARITNVPQHTQLNSSFKNTNLLKTPQRLKSSLKKLSALTHSSQCILLLPTQQILHLTIQWRLQAYKFQENGFTILVLSVRHTSEFFSMIFAYWFLPTKIFLLIILKISHMYAIYFDHIYSPTLLGPHPYPYPFTPCLQLCVLFFSFLFFFYILSIWEIDMALLPEAIHYQQLFSSRWGLMSLSPSVFEYWLVWSVCKSCSGNLRAVGS